MNPTKIHPTLLDELSLAARTFEADVLAVEEKEFPVIVRVREPRLLSKTRLTPRGLGMRVARRIDIVSALAGTATREEIEALSESDDVEIIWYDEPVYALLNTSVPRIGIPKVWQSGNQGKGMRICIVDTGLDVEHPDFEGRVAAVQDFTGEGPEDGSGHGTHVAGVAAGSGAASEGKYRGVAPEATILAAKVLRGDGTGRMSMVMAGIEWAVDQGAHVINLSLGSRGSCDGTDATSVTADKAVETGVVVVAAAGNDGPGSRTIGSPGCARKVITIGAATEDDRVADFSSRGPTKDARVKPDVLLPGVDIIAARADGTTLGRVVGEWYVSMNGTSMACPHAAGVAALMLEANPTLSPDAVKEIMMEATQSLGVDANLQGAGLVEADRAVALARAGRDSVTPAPSPEPEPTPSPVRPRPRPSQPPVGKPPVRQPMQETDGCFAPVIRLFRKE